MSTVASDTSSASRAIEAILGELAGAGIAASRDPSAFYPQPVGVLVGLPTLTDRGLGSATFTVPVLVVSGDPLTTDVAVDRIYRVAEACSYALSTGNYRPSQWAGSPNAEPLPAVELVATVSVTHLTVLPGGSQP